MMKMFSLIVANIQKYVPLKNFRSGQQTIYEAIRDAILAGHRMMYIEGPTGMGKSFIQSMISDSIINGSSTIKILLLVPKITLLTQMIREFKKFAHHLTLGLVGDGSKDFSGQVTIMTYQSFMRVDNSFLKHYAVFLLDEAHKALGPETRQKLEVQTHAILIGFTATPTYDEKNNLKNFLKYEAYRISIREAVKTGMLSAIQFILGKVRIEISEREEGETVQEYREKIGGDIMRQGGNIAAARLFHRLFKERGTRFIMFTASVQQGFDLVDELRKQSISAYVVHGEMKSNERQVLFDSFARDEFKVLVGIDTIKEGFDDVGVHGVMFVYPIGSVVGLIQGAGRGTRIDELAPHKIAYIVQLMFEGKNQVFYNKALDGKVLITPENEEEEITTLRKFNLVKPEELTEIFDDVLTSVSVDHEEVMKIVRDYNPLDFFQAADPEQQIQEIKAVLASKGIQSKADLMRFGSMRFNKHSFGVFGQGRAFVSLIFQRRIKEVTVLILHELAVLLQWDRTEEQQLEDWKHAFKEYGIVSSMTLFSYGIRKFTETEFGKYGKGRAFSRVILGRVVEKYVTAKTFQEITVRLNWSLSDEERMQHWKDLLSVHGITSRETLLKFGPRKFTITSFGDYGKGHAFAYEILDQQKNGKALVVQTLENISVKLGWTPTHEEQVKEWKDALKVYGIHSYTGLIDWGSSKFIKTSFGRFGKGSGFASDVLGKTELVTNQTLEEIAKILGWNFSKEDEFKSWLHELELHGITSRKTLLDAGLVLFTAMSFGRYGQGSAFAGKILGRSVSLTKEVLGEMATKLGWSESPEQQLEDWKHAFKEQGIMNRSDLLRVGPVGLVELSFGSYGKIRAFAGAILGNTQKSVDAVVLEQIATKLGWGITPEEQIKSWKNALAVHNITSRKELVMVGPVPFSRLDFGDYGKGSAFAGKVLGKTLKVRSDILESLADKLGWTVTTEQQFEDWKTELAMHNITSRESLVSYGQKKFKMTVFGNYGKGQAFVKTIIGTLTEEHFTNNDLVRVADKLGW